MNEAEVAADAPVAVEEQPLSPTRAGATAAVGRHAGAHALVAYPDLVEPFPRESVVKECYVLGCGRSLLALTKQEIAHVNRADLVLVFNKYVMFHEKIGIVPTHYYLGDVNPKADVYLEETHRRATEGDLPHLRFLLSRDYRLPLGAKVRYLAWAVLRTLRNWSGRRARERFARFHTLSRLARKVRGLPHVSFVQRCRWLEEDAWADSLEEPLLHHRGSLSDCINIACILAPASIIKLLGVDLSDHAYFFQEELEADPDRYARLLKRATPNAKEHETLLGFRGSGGIQERIPYMRAQVRRRGGDLVCCNRDSYLVEHGLLPFAGVLDSFKAPPE